MTAEARSAEKTEAYSAMTAEARSAEKTEAHSAEKPVACSAEKPEACSARKPQPIHMTIKAVPIRTAFFAPFAGQRLLAKSFIAAFDRAKADKNVIATAVKRCAKQRRYN